MHHLTLALLLSAGVAATAPTDAPAQVPHVLQLAPRPEGAIARVSGTAWYIRNSRIARAPGAVISCRRDSDGRVFRATADWNGNYTISLPAGRFTVSGSVTVAGRTYTGTSGTRLNIFIGGQRIVSGVNLNLR